MIYAVLGDIEFELLPITGLREDHAWNYAEHAVIEGKPLLQYIGYALDETTMTVRLHRRFCDPQAEFAKLKAAADKHLPMVFQVASGEIYGRRVVTRISRTIETTADNGMPISIEAELTLREYYDAAPITTRKIQQKSVAPALSGKPAVSVPRPAPGNVATLAGGQITQAAQNVSQGSNQMATLADKLKGGYASIAAQVKDAVAGIQATIDPVMQQAKQLAGNAQAAAAEIKGYAGTIQNYASNATRITSGIPVIGPQMESLTARMGRQTNNMITLSERAGGNASEVGVRAAMITRSVPR